MAPKELPPVDYLRQCFVYDPDTGVLTWLLRKAYRIQIGDVAGSPTDRGYLCVRLDGSNYKVHRIVWAMYAGLAAARPLDHVNGVKSDNRISNLREASSSENGRNTSAYRNNTSGYKGVSWHKRIGKWGSAIRLYGRVRHLGYFTEIEDAAAAYAAASKELHGEFGRV